MPLPEKQVTLARNETAVTFITAATTLGLYQNVVRASSSGSAYTITLPSVTEAKGMTFTFNATAISGNITIAHAGDSEQWTNIVLNGANDGVALFSDGRKWWTIASLGTPA